MSEQKKEVQVEKAPCKKELSYTYWVDLNNKSRELPEEHKPKKIEAQLPVADAPAGPGPSKWNTLGSWQQRTISMSELNQNTTQAVTRWLGENKCELKLSEVALEGEFKQIFSNKKQKILYDLSGKLKFEGDDLQLTIEDMTCSGDQEYSVKGKVVEEREKLQSVGAGVVAVLLQTFNAYKQ